jgi:hypothetical protein
MSEGEETVRLSVEIPKSLNDRLKLFLPWGSKTEVFRALIRMFVDTQHQHPEYLAQDLLAGRCKIVVVQNLNKSSSDSHD